MLATLDIISKWQTAKLTSRPPCHRYISSPMFNREKLSIQHKIAGLENRGKSPLHASVSYVCAKKPVGKTQQQQQSAAYTVGYSSRLLVF